MDRYPHLPLGISQIMSYPHLSPRIPACPIVSPLIRSFIPPLSDLQQPPDDGDDVMADDYDHDEEDQEGHGQEEYQDDDEEVDPAAVAAAALAPRPFLGGAFRPTAAAPAPASASSPEKAKPLSASPSPSPPGRFAWGAASAAAASTPPSSWGGGSGGGATSTGGGGHSMSVDGGEEEEEYVEGTCEDMCPVDERTRRAEAAELNIFERVDPDDPKVTLRWRLLYRKDPDRPNGRCLTVPELHIHIQRYQSAHICTAHMYRVSFPADHAP